MDLSLARGAGRLRTSHASCTCCLLQLGAHIKRRPLAPVISSRFLGGRQLGSGVSNGTCKLSAKQRAFHFEVGSEDEQQDDDRAFYDFANLEKQTKVVDEQRRRRYFESASDYKKRMQSQRFTTIRRARADSWVQPYAEVFEDEPSPFQEMFESPGASSLFATNEYVDGGFSQPDGANEFKDRQTYNNNGKPDTRGLSSGEATQADKFSATEADDLKDGMRKPMSSRVREEDDDAVPKSAPGSSETVNRVDARPASAPVKTAARAQQQAAQKSDASDFVQSSAPQGNIGTRPTATTNVPPSDNEPLASNQFQAPTPQTVPASKDTRKPKTPVKGFAGGKGSKPGKNPATSKGQKSGGKGKK